MPGAILRRLGLVSAASVSANPSRSNYAVTADSERFLLNTAAMPSRPRSRAASTAALLMRLTRGLQPVNAKPSIEHEPFDPRPIDRRRMDLHNCHARSTGPPSFAGITTTMVAARRSKSRGTRSGNRAPARGVPPGQQSVEGSCHDAAGRSRAASEEDKGLSPRRLQTVLVGRRSVPPTWRCHCAFDEKPLLEPA
jgi:hypothetical protein